MVCCNHDVQCFEHASVVRGSHYGHALARNSACTFQDLVVDGVSWDTTVPCRGWGNFTSVAYDLKVMAPNIEAASKAPRCRVEASRMA